MSEEIKLIPRHRAFADEYIANGFNGLQAYLTVYGENTIDTAKVNACKLLTRANIKKYIKNHQEEMTLKSQLTVEWVLNELTELIKDAKEVGNPHELGNTTDRSAVINSLKEINKLLGHYPAEKKEVSVTEVKPITYRKLPKHDEK